MCTCYTEKGFAPVDRQQCSKSHWVPVLQRENVSYINTYLNHCPFGNLCSDFPSNWSEGLGYGSLSETGMVAMSKPVGRAEPNDGRNKKQLPDAATAAMCQEPYTALLKMDTELFAFRVSWIPFFFCEISFVVPLLLTCKKWYKFLNIVDGCLGPLSSCTKSLPSEKAMVSIE